MYSSRFRFACHALGVLAAGGYLAACGDTSASGNGIVVADAESDVVTLPDADTGDVATDTVSPADIAADASSDTATDAALDTQADAITGADTDTAPDAATDAVVEDTTPADTGFDADVAAEDAATDVSVADVDDATPPPDVAPDVPDTTDVPVVPTCKSVSDCGGDTPYCNAAGTCVGCLYNAQCPGDGAFCANGACTTPVTCISDKDCTPIGAVCDPGKGVCRECLTELDCKGGQKCQAFQCVTVTPCKSSKDCPGALVCSAGACVECAADTDCDDSQFCSQKICTKDVCKPGAHCELNAVATCKANGGGWDYTDCGLTAICLSAACAPVVCAPDSVGCQDGGLATCNNTGTQLTVAACPAKQTCVGNACTAVICTAKTTACDENGGLLTCSDDGTQWVYSSCGTGYACSLGTCTQQICAPGSKTCSGQKLLACTALGLAWSITATCSDTGQYCVTDKCVDPLCTPGSVKCDGNQLTTCNADAMSWTPTPCDDGNACTSDTCDAGLAKCAFASLNCDDGNSCTLDSCSGGCQHAGVTGPTCDDGNSCSTGETCNAGKCVAPVASANVTTVAGSGSIGGTNGAGSSASFNRPYGLARLNDGSFAVSDYDANRIRQVQTDGTVSTIAGTGTAGSTDGVAASATFSSPTSMAMDAAGTLFVADFGNDRIRTVSGGVVGTFAGSSVGWKDGVGTAAQFHSVQDIKFDANGVLWAADRLNHRIRRITADGAVSTAAGTGVAGYVDGPIATAQLNEPCRIAPASDGSVYFADCGNYRVRKLSADGQTISTIAGAGNGYVDGNATSAKFAWIGGLAWLGNTLIVSDNGNNRIRAVAADGTVSTLAGSGSASYVDGAPTSASFSAPWNVGGDWTGALWIADGTNERIRKLSFSNLTCNDGNPCTTDSCAGKACVFTPIGAGAACNDGTACTSNDACSAQGKCTGTATTCNDGNPCTSDFCNPLTGACVFTSTDGPCVDNDICTNGEHCSGGACLANVNTLSTVAGTSTAGYVDGAAKDARFNAPFGLAVTKDGGSYVSDANNDRIRFVAADGTTSTVAGSGTAGYLDGAASTAQFNNPTRLAIGAQGVLYIADSVNNRIRKLSGTTVSTVAGSGTTGFLDGAPTSAQFNNPFGLVYNSGVLYVADSGNHRIRTIAPDGTVGTLAGSSTVGNTDGTLGNATFSSPRGLCQASDGTLYVVDTYNNNIRRIVNGKVDTLAGGGPGADDGIGLAAGFNQPRDCTVDPAGNIYVTDTYDNRLRKVTPNGVVTTLAGTTIGNGSMYTSTDGPALTSVLGYPAVPAWAPGGVIWIADNNSIRKFIPANVDCSDGLPCTTDVCNGVTGACSSSPTPNGGACDDGKFCTVGETCQSNTCGNSTPNTCDDAQSCTTDSCDPILGCSHTWQFTLPGCCLPTLWQTGFEGDKGAGVKTTADANSYTTWGIGASSTTHGGTSALSATYLYGTSKATATLPAITLPAGTTTLSFWLYFDAVPSTCGTGLTYPCGTSSFQVLINGFGIYTQTAATSGWTQVTLNSSLIGGQTPVVTFVYTSANSGWGSTFTSTGTGVFVDDITVTSTCQ